MFQTGQHTPVSEVAASLSAVETTPRMPVVLDDKVTPSLLKREHNDNNDKITELLNKIKMEDLTILPDPVECLWRIQTRTIAQNNPHKKTVP